MRIRTRISLVIALASLSLQCVRAEPDESLLGKDNGYPVGNIGNVGNWYFNPYRVGSWSAMDEVGFPVRTVARRGSVLALPMAAQPSTLRYRFGNVEYTLDDYLERQRITGLLVLRNGEIVAERYRYNRGAGARFLSFSMAKSVTSLLVGIARERGVIGSLEDPADKAELTSEWLWQPMGAEQDGFWVLSRDGHERSSGFFNATLRDWGRLGAMLARDGRAGDRQVVPRDYLLDATDVTRQPAAFAPRVATPYFGYGYQFWLFPMRERSFALLGIHGQAMFVQPASGIVVVQTSAFEAASALKEPHLAQERDALWRGVLQSLGGSTTP